MNMAKDYDDLLESFMNNSQKVYNEDIRILSSMYYRLSFQATKYRLEQESKKYNSSHVDFGPKEVNSSSDEADLT